MNAYRKTWTEYANRLLGVTTGFLIFLTVFFSATYLKRDKPVFWVTLGAFFLVAFKGWLGSRVVASNLTPGMITAHMITAQGIVALLIYSIARSQKGVLSTNELRSLPRMYYLVLKVAMVMTLLQMAMGTQVREAIDIIAHQFNYADRNLWVENLPVIFLIHRSFSSIILLTNLWLVWRLLRSAGRSTLLFRLAIGLAVLIVSAIVLGVLMDRLQVPAFAQPLHMWLASLIFGTQLFLFMIIRYTTREPAYLTEVTGITADKSR